MLAGAKKKACRLFGLAGLGAQNGFGRLALVRDFIVVIARRVVLAHQDVSVAGEGRQAAISLNRGCTVSVAATNCGGVSPDYLRVMAIVLEVGVSGLDGLP